ncbi:YbaK/EbsC family protein [Ligaoa zhengdingensis]
MSYERVKEYFKEIGLSDRITVQKLTGDTVEHAAEVIGCTPAEIAKAMSFLVNEKPVMVVMAGDAKVNSSKFKAKFHLKPIMVPHNEVENLIGHKPGGVCPFAVNEGVPIYLDVSMKRFTQVYTAGGIDTVTIRVSVEELERYSHAIEWIDVCKGWYVNDLEGAK